MREKVQQVKGENDRIKGQHQEARKEFMAANPQQVPGGGGDRDPFRTGRDSSKGRGDSPPAKESALSKAGVLERDSAGKDPRQSGDVKALQAEVARMKHENKDFAAELDKAQSLLKLQTDIERENRQYHEQEKRRLELLAQSTSLKAQEMAQRVDGLGNLIKKLGQKLGRGGGPARSASPDGRGAGPHDPLAGPSDVRSDFSVNSNESEGQADENYFDLRVIEGSLNEELIDAFLRSYGSREYYFKDLITLVSVDFYDHNTETTQLTQGYRPKYRSQISFKNKMDPYYI